MKLRYLVVLGLGMAFGANAAEVAKKDVYAENVQASFERSLEPLQAADLAITQVLRIATLDAKMSDESISRSHELIMQ